MTTNNQEKELGTKGKKLADSQIFSNSIIHENNFSQNHFFHLAKTNSL